MSFLVQIDNFFGKFINNLDPDSLKICFNIINNNPNNYLQYDCPPISTLDIYNNGKLLESITDYHILSSFLNDITYKTSYYENNHINERNELEDYLSIGSRTKTIPPKLMGTDKHFNPDKRVMQFYDDYAYVKNGSIKFNESNSRRFEFNVISFLFGKYHSRTSNGYLLPDSKFKSKLVPAFLFKSLQFVINLNMHAFFVPIFNINENDNFISILGLFPTDFKVRHERIIKGNEIFRERSININANEININYHTIAQYKLNEFKADLNERNGIFIRDILDSTETTDQAKMIYKNLMEMWGLYSFFNTQLETTDIYLFSLKRRNKWTLIDVYLDWVLYKWGGKYGSHSIFGNFKGFYLGTNNNVFWQMGLVDQAEFLVFNVCEGNLVIAKTTLAAPLLNENAIAYNEEHVKELGNGDYFDLANKAEKRAQAMLNEQSINDWKPANSDRFFAFIHNVIIGKGIGNLIALQNFVIDQTDIISTMQNEDDFVQMQSYIEYRYKDLFKWLLFTSKYADLLNLYQEENSLIEFFGSPLLDKTLLFRTDLGVNISGNRGTDEPDVYRVLKKITNTREEDIRQLYENLVELDDVLKAEVAFNSIGLGDKGEVFIFENIMRIIDSLITMIKLKFNKDPLDTPDNEKQYVLDKKIIYVMHLYLLLKHISFYVNDSKEKCSKLFVSLLLPIFFVLLRYYSSQRVNAGFFINQIIFNTTQCLNDMKTRYTDIFFLYENPYKMIKKAKIITVKEIPDAAFTRETLNEINNSAISRSFEFSPALKLTEIKLRDESIKNHYKTTGYHVEGI